MLSAAICTFHQNYGMTSCFGIIIKKNSIYTDLSAVLIILAITAYKAGNSRKCVFSLGMISAHTHMETPNLRHGYKQRHGWLNWTVIVSFTQGKRQRQMGEKCVSDRQTDGYTAKAKAR